MKYVKLFFQPQRQGDGNIMLIDPKKLRNSAALAKMIRSNDKSTTLWDKSDDRRLFFLDFEEKKDASSVATIDGSSSSSSVTSFESSTDSPSPKTAASVFIPTTTPASTTPNTATTTTPNTAATTTTSTESISTTTTPSSSSSSSSSLSDIDTRVLQSMLQDETLFKPDLREKLQQILVEPKEAAKQKSSSTKTATATSNTVKNSRDPSSQYSSSFFKTMDEFNKSFLWNSFKAKADEIVESFQILVSNRIERDVNVLASLGFFTWQRIVKDVARALPSSGRSGARMAQTMRNALYQLASNSSFVPYSPQDNFILPPAKYSNDDYRDENLYEEFNSPLDEIKSVTSQVRDILTGRKVILSTSSNAYMDSINTDRTLKSVAPAGFARIAERQRRAYESGRNRILTREKENIDVKMGRAVNYITDTIWEMSRELQVEGNTPGYRTEPIIRSIKEGAEAQFSALLPGSYESKIFFPSLSQSKMKDGPIKSLSAATQGGDGDSMENLPSLSSLQEERARLTASLRLCLEQQEKIRLLPENLSVATDNQVNATRNETESDGIKDLKYTEARIISELEKMKQIIDTISTLTTLLKNLDTVIERRSEINKNKLSPQREIKDDWAQQRFASSVLISDKDREYFNTTESTIPEEEQSRDRYISRSFEMHPVIDVLPTKEATESEAAYYTMETSMDHALHTETVPWDGNDEETFEIATEVQVIVDEDIESLNLKETKAVNEATSIGKEDRENILVTVTLRTLDILFFLAEKAITVGIPGMVQIGRRLLLRIEDIDGGGLGKEGWEPLPSFDKNSPRFAK